MDNYLIVSIKSWNIDNFYKYTKHFPGNWYLIAEKDKLNLENINKINPKKIFVWKIFNENLEYFFTNKSVSFNDHCKWWKEIFLKKYIRYLI